MNKLGILKSNLNVRLAWFAESLLINYHGETVPCKVTQEINEAYYRVTLPDGQVVSFCIDQMSPLGGEETQFFTIADFEKGRDATLVIPNMK